MQQTTDLLSIIQTSDALTTEYNYPISHTWLKKLIHDGRGPSVQRTDGHILIPWGAATEWADHRPLNPTSAARVLARESGRLTGRVPDPPLHRLVFTMEEHLADLLAFYIRSHHHDAWTKFLRIPGRQRRDRLNAITAQVSAALWEYLNAE